MVKVYKTTVDEQAKAKSILDLIRKELPGCEPSFDLEDCDNVLRVESPHKKLDEQQLRAIVVDSGYRIETLL